MHLKSYIIILITVLLAACATPSVAPSSPQGSNTAVLYITDGKKTGFSIYQAGRLVNAPWESGYLTYRLANGNFTIRTKYKGLRMYLAEKDAGEFRQSKKTRLNVLSSVLTGASEADSDTLFVADYTDPLSSNNSIDPSSGLKTAGQSENSYAVRTLYFLKTREEVSVSGYAGTLFGYAWVDLNGDQKIGLDEVSRFKLLINSK